MMITFKAFADHFWHVLSDSNRLSEGTDRQKDNTAGRINPLSTLSPCLEKPQTSIQCYIRQHCCLPLQESALTALRSACHAPGIHSHFTDLVPVARDYGLSDNDIQSIKQFFHPYGWSKQQQLLLFITDEWHLNGSVRMALWEKLEAQYTWEQIFCLVLCSAQGHLLASP